MSSDKMGGPAFPVNTAQINNPGACFSDEGMTQREYAAIHLKVPNSGNPELDAMIERALWHDYAVAVLPAVTREGFGDALKPSEVASDCALYADAMLAERAKRGGS